MRLFLAIILIIVSFIQFVFISFVLNFVRYGHANAQESSSFDYGILILYVVAILFLIITSLSKEIHFLLMNGTVAGVLFVGLLVYFWQTSIKAIQFFSLNLLLILGILITNLIYFFSIKKTKNDKI